MGCAPSRRRVAPADDGRNRTSLPGAKRSLSDSHFSPQLDGLGDAEKGAATHSGRLKSSLRDTPDRPTSVETGRAKKRLQKSVSFADKLGLALEETQTISRNPSPISSESSLARHVLEPMPERRASVDENAMDNRSQRSLYFESQIDEDGVGFGPSLSSSSLDSLLKSPAQLVAESLMASANVFMFTLSNCSHCQQAGELFQSIGVAFSTVDLDKRKDGHEISGFLGSHTGSQTMPRIFINNESIGGYSELKKLAARGSLGAILDAGHIPYDEQSLSKKKSILKSFF